MTLLALFYFLFVVNAFFSLMRLTIDYDHLNWVKASRRGPLISHLLFTDDCILFKEVTNIGVRTLKRIMKEYESHSSQCVNFEKTTSIFNANTPDSVRIQL